MNELLLILLAYLIGSIPTSVWVSQHFFDIDIRDYGSGNAGATNTYRVLGPKWGTVVMVADMLKGVLAVKLALLLPEYADSEVNLQNLQTGLGLAAVIGHIFPIWADFRGGKGVATLFGLVLGISPFTAMGCVGIFILVLYLTRFVSLSSILASIAFPIFILVIFNVENPAYRVFAIAVAMMVLLTHQKNIGRLLNGNESKVPILKNRDRRRQRRRDNTSGH
ncbi:MAG: glycerol-3-phosphate 1-O-acyltransferase PlsY [Chitinophagaceae bacterium]|jgi:glycerol-3-phosphate acyltransferase PlsY|nr:glycerol-3-phosphate 1-O-acyltransferase PlsY [Chitinophagaceae bacterium]MBK7679732.1 glycerol-3-phosphate 1-O-acyltransferase PlsY [Chitinophagaceae bacterium]MBK8298915.1 glycerol-3-phosphate 1-O-acyltransferase PlsY [Chitinophagaceae bacterium]MBK9464737.1 glycerol-3-phosphate 1-O-acyltransferase PlsY [Chitinophagaceae bacterium]MBK9659904.1 glycerol-3-phosphate 1-O-acyltransferase PlsY [Chitinophagaceae bacterium]